MKLFSVAFTVKPGVHQMIDSPVEFILAPSFEAAYNKAKELGGESLEVGKLTLEIGKNLVVVGSNTTEGVVNG